MTPDEARRAVIALAKLFPGQVTDQQSRDARREFLAYPLDAVEASVRKQRKEKQFVDWPQLYRDAEAHERAAKAGAGPRREESWCDDQRRKCAAWNGMARAGDVEVILRVLRQQFHEAGRGAGYRPQILVSCRSHLVAVYPFAPTDEESRPTVEDDGTVTSARAMTPDEAADMAEWVDRTADLIFAAPDVFRMALDDLRQSAGTSNVPDFAAT